MEEEKELTEEQVWNIVNYVDGLYRDIKTNGWGVLDNYIYNSDNEKINLKNLTDNPKVLDLEEIRNAQANWKNNDELLRDVSTFYKYWDGLYAKALRYYSNLLGWNYSFYCTNASGDDYKSEEYKKDYNKVLNFFNNFDVKKEGDKVIRNCLVTDSYYTWFRKSSLGYTLQVMPQKYCKITGSSAVSNFLYDFNLNYFYNSTVNIENYDASLIKAFNSINEEGGLNYDANRLKEFAIRKGEINRTATNNNWVRTKVSSGAWCWKFNSDTFSVVPPFSALFKNLFDDDTIVKLQKNKDMIASNFILWGEMPLKKEGMTGTEKNAFKVDAKIMGQLLKMARSAFIKDSKIVALPLENTRSAQFMDGNSLMSQNYLSSSASQLNSVPELIYNTGKMSQEITKNALMSDYQWVSKIYNQMEDFLNYFVNKETETYKFKFTVEGSTLYWDIKDKQESIGKIIDRGILPNISKIASLWNMKPQELIAMMDEMKNGDTIDKLQLLLNSNTSKDGSSLQNGSNSEGGRPLNEDGSTDSSDIGRDYS